MIQSQLTPLQIFVAAIQSTGTPDRALTLAQQNPGESEGDLGCVLAGSMG